MAKDIADSLKIFSSHAGGFSWTERRHGFMTSTVEKVMEFAQQHGMKDMVLDQLDEETKQKLDAFCAMGRITTEAYDAVTDLVHDADGTKPLTIEEKRRCIDKIVLAKAVQVDVQSSTKDLADRMVSEAERNELAKKGSAAICNAFDLQRVGYGNWATHMKNNEAAEARRRLDIRREKDIFKNFEERLAKLQALGADKEFEPLIEAYAKIMESGSEVSKKFLASLSEDNLRLCNQALKDNPKLDLNKALMAHAKAETIQNGQPAVQAAPQR